MDDFKDLKEENSNKKIITILILGIIIILGICGYILFKDDIFKKEKIDIDVEVKEEKLCSKVIEFNNKNYLCNFNKEENDFILKIYDDMNIVSVMKQLDYFKNEEVNENKEEYCNNEEVNMYFLKEEGEYFYFATYWKTSVPAQYIVYTLKDGKYSKVVDLSKYSTGNFVDPNTLKTIEPYQIKDGKIYVINNSLIDKNYKDGEEMEVSLLKGKYIIISSNKNVYVEPSEIK